MSAVTILCRDGAALEAALEQFCALLTADTAITRASVGGGGSTALLTPAGPGRAALHLLALPGAAPPASADGAALHLLCAHAGAFTHGSLVRAALLASAPTPSLFGAALRALRGGRAALPRGARVLPAAAGADAEAEEPLGALAHAGSCSGEAHVKEIVVGAADGAALRSSAAALAAGGAERANFSPAVWLGGGGAAVRLLPSRFSALVLHAPGLGAAGAGGGGGGGGSVGGAPAEAYGSRGAGQLALRAPALAGLDVRVCAATGAAAAAWAEAPRALDEDVVDPALNPPAGAASKKVSLNCRTLVGMELAATLRLRLAEQLR
jgi:hypothetical protein